VKVDESLKKLEPMYNFFASMKS
jgi:dynein heavy chain